ncbi:hypothetical protein TIFTF001_020095 [Ficus carica]|uniref:Equilibrative nucleoside transporter n=1 Tax=Ficus carica TaxID=3494 RepID=A0AA88DAP8_FICCA|nr:hypothetical protein TIFTF001_020095 [Ficus carica]
MYIANESGVDVKYEGRYKAILVCWVLGLGSLVAWNSMLTIGDYYYALFPHYHPSRVLTIVYQPFAVGCMAILAYHEAKIDTRTRNIFGYSLFFISTFLLIVVDLVSHGKGGVAPYVGICILVAFFGIADAHVQGGMIGDLSFMLPEFIQSFMAGLAGSAISAFFEFICIFLYAYVFPKLPIVKHFRKKAALEGSKTVASDLAAVGVETQSDQPIERMSKKQLILENIDYVLGLYLIYVVTLSIFPGFLYENTGNHKLGTWYPLVLVAMYNALDFVGRYTPLVKRLNLESRKGLFISIITRFLFIPAFYFTAKYADKGWMIMLISLLGLTNGHLTVCVLTAAPKGYKGPEQNALGNILVVFLLGGIFSGVSLGWLWIIGNDKF